MNKTALGTYEIAKICQVSPPTVGRWVEEGKLPSFTTGGGHRRVWLKDLVVFMKAHNMAIPPDLAAGAGPVRILVVDDDTNVRHAIKRILKKEFLAAEIYEASDGFEAGHKIANLAPQLVILDMRLPGVDGLKVCRTIRADGRLTSVKVLAVSGYGIAEMKQKALEAGADDFLAKPFDFEEFTAKVRGFIGAQQK